ncbi:MAG: hypothetical protein MRJ92_08985 [Nitrospira sp.]|nr:hypothetical protein [Nitrospira sp.]
MGLLHVDPRPVRRHGDLIACEMPPRYPSSKWDVAVVHTPPPAGGQRPATSRGSQPPPTPQPVTPPKPKQVPVAKAQPVVRQVQEVQQPVQQVQPIQESLPVQAAQTVQRVTTQQVRTVTQAIRSGQSYV